MKGENFQNNLIEMLVLYVKLPRTVHSKRWTPYETRQTFRQLDWAPFFCQINNGFLKGLEECKAWLIVETIRSHWMYQFCEQNWTETHDWYVVSLNSTTFLKWTKYLFEMMALSSKVVIKIVRMNAHTVVSRFQDLQYKKINSDNE